MVMAKIYTIEGKFEIPNVTGRFGSKFLEFTGFVEVDDDVQSHIDPNKGVVDVQDFRGVILNKEFRWKGIPRLLVGQMEQSEQQGRALSFNLDMYDENSSYWGSKCDFLFNDNDAGSIGWWSCAQFPSETPAYITKFEPMTDKEIGKKRVKSFLKKGYDITYDDLSPQMKAAIKDQQTKKEQGRAAYTAPVTDEKPKLSGMPRRKMYPKDGAENETTQKPKSPETQLELF